MPDGPRLKNSDRPSSSPPAVARLGATARGRLAAVGLAAVALDPSLGRVVGPVAVEEAALAVEVAAARGARAQQCRALEGALLKERRAAAEAAAATPRRSKFPRAKSRVVEELQQRPSSAPVHAGALWARRGITVKITKIILDDLSRGRFSGQ